MLLLLLLVVKSSVSLERKNTIPSNPTLVKKYPIINFAPLPTFPPLFFTTLHPKSRTFASFPGLQWRRQKQPERRALPTFLLTTTQPPPTFTSLTYRGVSRPLVDLLRAQLHKTPPASSTSLNVATSNMSSCSFLSGSLRPLSGTCTASGACRVGRTDYQANACSNAVPTSSVANHCVVNSPLKRTRGMCSSEGHCIGRCESHYKTSLVLYNTTDSQGAKRSSMEPTTMSDEQFETSLRKYKSLFTNSGLSTQT